MGAISLFIVAISEGFKWFSEVMTAAGLDNIFLGVILITLIFYRLISPMMRSGASDQASKKRQKDDD